MPVRSPTRWPVYYYGAELAESFGNAHEAVGKEGPVDDWIDQENDRIGWAIGLQALAQATSLSVRMTGPNAKRVNCIWSTRFVLKAAPESHASPTRPQTTDCIPVSVPRQTTNRVPVSVPGDLIGRLVKVVGKLLDDAKVSRLRTLSESGELKVLMHALAKSSRHQWVLSRRREVKNVWNPL
jgi:hypothetical protein